MELSKNKCVDRSVCKQKCKQQWSITELRDESDKISGQEKTLQNNNKEKVNQ